MDNRQAAAISPSPRNKWGARPPTQKTTFDGTNLPVVEPPPMTTTGGVNLQIRLGVGLPSFTISP
jgi:hypothetical protein